MSELTLLYVPSPSIGYGRLGVHLAKSLLDLGVDVFDTINSPNDMATNHMTRQVKDRRAKQTNAACWVSTPGHARGWFTGQHAAIFTMWEAMRLPEAYREHLHHFDTVVVPSMQNVELFSQYHPNVRYVPLGVDPAQWHYVPRTRPDVFFNFLCGGSGARKGTDLAFKAFRKAFPDDSWGDGPIPRMIFKNPKGEDFYHPRVEVMSGRLTAEDEIALYESAHCYVQPSRGEGFGLQPIQAMAQGIPTILTNAHGHAAFAHLGYGISAKSSKSSYFIYGDAGDWWEPDLDELIDNMRWVYNNHEQSLALGKFAADTVASDFTWEQTARKFVAAFDGALDLPYTGDGTWFTPAYKVYLTVLNRDWNADIAGNVYQFKKGVTYYEHSDVKRILFEAGLLDPVCLEMFQKGETTGILDTGLTEQEVARIGAYSARHAHCSECGQALGGKTKADAIFEELEDQAKARVA